MSQEKNKQANTYSDVYESCYICGRDMFNINRIYVEIDSDKYICQVCKKTHAIYAVKCVEI